MPVVEVEEIVEVPRDAFFAVITDHAGYDRFPGIRRSELIRNGHTEKNGVGAVRRLNLGAAVLDEEIVAYEASTSYSYRITKVRPLPVHHKLGTVTLTELAPDRTKVYWTSEFEVRLPIVGGLLGKQLKHRFTGAFKSLIRAAAKLAQPA